MARKLAIRKNRRATGRKGDEEEHIVVYLENGWMAAIELAYDDVSVWGGEFHKN